MAPSERGPGPAGQAGGPARTADRPVGAGPLQREFLRSRWLDQVHWLEHRATSCQRRYHRLAVVTLVGGLVIPALVGLGVGSAAAQTIRWVTFGVGLLVGLATAIEGLFCYGDRWRHYRQTTELLKSEGWQFFQHSGRYAGSADHAAGYPLFAAQVEAILQHDVETYITTVVAKRDQNENRK